MSEANRLEPAVADERRRRIEQVADECLRLLMEGRQVSDEAILSAHAELLPELAEELRRVRLVVAGGQDAAQAQEHEPALRLRCPHCHTPRDIPTDSSLSNITCSSCGQVFSLVDDGSEPSELARLENLAHFQVIEHLGSGGFGSVYKARDTQLDRLVAIKIPRRKSLSAQEAEQFLREARAAAQLRHPNIVSIHEVGKSGDTIYIVNDFVPGESLARWLKSQRMSVREAARLCQKIALALHHAHEAGIVHRDLKPENILLDDANEPHLMDFGLARREAGEVTVTMDGQVVGTPAYMSPEQAKGESHQSDRRSDLYSLGVILFELLTGELPFRGNVRMLTRQIIEDEPPSPRKFNITVPRDLETVCLKCLEKDPDRRYATAKDLADDLGRYLNREVIHARPVGRLERTWRWCRRKPARAGLIASLIVIAVGGPIVALHEVANRRAAEATARESYRQQYFSDMHLAMEEWEQGNVDAATGLLNRHRPQPSREDLRGFEWYYLWKQSQRGLRAPMIYHWSYVRCVAFSPDGKTLATSGDFPAILLSDVGTGRPRLVLDGHDDGAPSVAFSRNGKMLAAGFYAGLIKIYDLDAGRELRAIDAHKGIVKSVAFSPDGKTVASAGDDGTIHLWDVPGERERHPPLTCPQALACVAYSADGRLLAAGSEMGVVYLWDAQTWTLLHTFTPARSTAANSIAFSPDSKTLASAHGDRSIRLWSVGGDETPRTLVGHLFEGHNREVLALAYAPDGKTLASGGADGMVKLWDPARGEVRETLRGHGSKVFTVAFSPDGNLLASGSADNSVKLWDLAARQEPWRIAANPAGVSEPSNALAFAPDGATVASPGENGILKLIDPATGEMLMNLEGRAGPLHAVAFSPDGRLVAAGGNADASGEYPVRLWDRATGNLLRSLVGHRGAIQALTFSPDSRVVASGSADASLKLWDTASGLMARSLTRSLETGPVSAVAFSPDGTTLAATNNTQVVVWDPATGSELYSFDTHIRGTNCLAFSPDGRILAGGGEDWTVAIWDTTSRRLGRTLRGHADAISGVAFSPDGKTLATASKDANIRLWDVASGHERAVLHGQGVRVSGVAFSPNGRVLAASGIDPAVQFWRAANAEDVPSGIVANIDFNDATRAADRRWLEECLAKEGVIRINCGGDDYRSVDGVLWGHDRFYVRDRSHVDFGYWPSEPSTTQGMRDRELYLSGRVFRANSEQPRAYLIPVPPGRYRVVLHFAEVFIRRPGRRVFDVSINGRTVLENFEPGAAGFHTAQSRSFETNVPGGPLEISFVHRHENPMIAAIEVYRLDSAPGGR